MIRVIKGSPGTGKTLYAVKCLLEAKKRGDYIITNIHGFKQADECIDDLESEQLSKFILDRDWAIFAQELNGRKVYFVLDEAQRVYPKTGMLRGAQNDLLYFLEYHRHYGLNVDLITQDHKNLSERIFGLTHEIVQISKISTFSGKQRIRRLDPITWELIAKEEFKRKQEYYDAYISASVEAGHQKPPTPMSRIYKLSALAIVAFVISGFVLYNVVVDWLGYDKPAQEIAQPKPVHTTSVEPKTITIKDGKLQDSIASTEPQEKLSRYQKLGLELDQFYLISTGRLLGEDLTIIGYQETGRFTPQTLSKFDLEYVYLGNGSALLSDKHSTDSVVIFLGDKPYLDKYKDNNSFDLPSLSSIGS